jgi:hypothetical protein
MNHHFSLAVFFAAQESRLLSHTGIRLLSRQDSPVEPPGFACWPPVGRLLATC